MKDIENSKNAENMKDAENSKSAQNPDGKRQAMLTAPIPGLTQLPKPTQDIRPGSLLPLRASCLFAPSLFVPASSRLHSTGAQNS